MTKISRLTALLYLYDGKVPSNIPELDFLSKKSEKLGILSLLRTLILLT
jgi:hypothetical protein